MPRHRTLLTFHELVKSEHDQLERAAALESKTPPGQVDKREFIGEVGLDRESGEPWLVKKSVDRVGLALSGGGIRSATFGLGLLQSLARHRVLGLVDYMSTVSGGGYLGGFWTAWKQRSGNKEVFPGAEGEPGKSGEPGRRESAEIRHLREFSRFLAPRIGLNEPETWNAVAAVLGGMFPALLATIAVTALVFYAWLGLGGYIAQGTAGWTVSQDVLCSVLLATGLIIGGGLLFPKVRQVLNKEGDLSVNRCLAYAGLFAFGFLLWCICFFWLATMPITPLMTIFGVVSIGLHLWFECAAWRHKRSEREKYVFPWILMYSMMALATTGLGMWTIVHTDSWCASIPHSPSSLLKNAGNPIRGR